jgi:predicted nucleic acid-binding protein
MPSKLYWDACIHLSLINGIPERLPAIEALIEEARRGDVLIYTSTVSLTEVAYAAIEKDNHALNDDIEQKIDEMFADREVLKVVEYHELIAREARRKIRQAVEKGWSLKPMDAIHLATAARIGVTEFHTYDDRLLKYKGQMGFLIREPASLNPRLPGMLRPSE